jgi:hypothetical protein
LVVAAVAADVELDALPEVPTAAVEVDPGTAVEEFPDVPVATALSSTKSLDPSRATQPVSVTC